MNRPSAPSMASPPQQPAPIAYTHGHHQSVLRSHSWRTAKNSAAYLLPHLRPHMAILDIGCGPGSITVDLARLVPQGKVVGLDSASDAVEQARKMAKEAGVENCEFRVGDIHALDFPDEAFDVVHVHQVLQHLSDPVHALREMRRVAKSGGLVAAREVDFSATTVYPEWEELTQWREVYMKVARHNGGEPDAGRRLLAWARQAGLEREKITATAGTWCFSSPEDREWWSSTSADRFLASAVAKTAVEAGIASEGELQNIARAWRRWGEEEDGWFGMMHGEIIYRK